MTTVVEKFRSTAAVTWIQLGLSASYFDCLGQEGTVWHAFDGTFGSVAAKQCLTLVLCIHF